MNVVVFLHKKYKSYDEYSDNIKEGVDMILDMIKQISCNNQNDVYDAYIKYVMRQIYLLMRKLHTASTTKHTNVWTL